eukprot:CAMPEP_0184276372 /NCGR_PEP_ID=MMETSP0977-20130417/49294_1 /TAXON_ID=483370 /ORGANISM="non described non described, Strain CCMP2097" /LENGTH=40 /DNA_ID= /DNA_START= /DNA_END= /DNA_ORIENTATION=
MLEEIHSMRIHARWYVITVTHARSVDWTSTAATTTGVAWA